MRTVLVFTSLFALMLVAFQYFKPHPSAGPAGQQVTQQNTAASRAAAEKTSNEPAAAVVTPATTPAVAAAAEIETVVENELYRIVFTNRGARVREWTLKKYTDSRGRPLNLVHPSADENGYPLSVFVYDEGLRKQIDGALFVPSSAGSLTAPADLTFRYSGNGLEVTKSFHFSSDYVLHATLSVERNGQPVRALLAWPSGLGDQEAQPHYAGGMFNWSTGGKDDGLKFNKVSGGATLTQSFDWAGISDLYFAAIFLPDNPAQATAVTFSHDFTAPREAANPAGGTFKATVLGVALGSLDGPTAVRLYAGPKQLDVLSRVHAMGSGGREDGPSLKPLVQFGWLKVVAEPLFLGLRWIYVHVVPSWGWAIILVTVAFNLAMFPTRISMMKSSLRMQRLQPQMDAIKARYKNLKLSDPRRSEMNAEIMELQRREGVSPFSLGCLPLLLQMPLLFAFYRVLGNAIELRHAHWGWLPDLAAPDPYHALPLFIIVSMFLVQFITPSPGMDPAQQRMMAFTMPAVIGFTMWHLPGGLALYWATGNVINTGIQFFLNRSRLGREMREIAARRAARRLGKR
jgi:YidC/Oxa1 family membrane protein insertase